VHRLLSRRIAITGLAFAGCAWAELIEGQKAAAASSNLPHLSASTDPTAAALHYVEDASTVDRKKFANFQPSQSCSTCLHLKGAAGDPWRPCETYPGKLVSVKGWCQIWAKKG
jgi:hypothetical protein